MPTSAGDDLHAMDAAIGDGFQIAGTADWRPDTDSAVGLLLRIRHDGTKLAVPCDPDLPHYLRHASDKVGFDGRRLPDDTPWQEVTGLLIRPDDPGWGFQPDMLLLEASIPEWPDEWSNQMLEDGITILGGLAAKVGEIGWGDTRALFLAGFEERGLS